MTMPTQERDVNDTLQRRAEVFSGMYLNLTKVSPLDEIKKPQNLETEFDLGHNFSTVL